MIRRAASALIALLIVACTYAGPTDGPFARNYKIGGALGFILIALIWFYLLSLAILAGAVINALRYELRDTGSLDLPGFREGTPT